MQTDMKASLSKVPEVTLAFWIIKIAATTLGETGGDTVSMTLQWGYLVGTALFVVAARGAGRSFRSPRSEVSSVPLLGDDHRLHDLRHDDGRFRRPLAGHRLCRRLVDSAALPAGRARPLVLVARLHLGRHGQHAEGGGLLLGGHHVLADAGNGARRLDGRFDRASATTAARWSSASRWRLSRRPITGPMCRACCCSGRHSS